MAYAQMLPVENVFKVDGFYSLYRFSLLNMDLIGELHDFYEIVYVESGFYYTLLDGKRHTVPPGSCIFFAPNTYHSWDGSTRVDATVRIISFECKNNAMRRFDNRVFELTDNEKELFFRAFDAASKCVTSAHRNLRIKEGATAADLQYAKLQLESFLLKLYSITAPQPEESGKAAARKAEFRRISDYLKSNLHRPLTLDDISAECSVSISKLKSLCKFFCDCGPIDYLISLRIIRAKYLILEGELNFGEIAEKTGFSSPHYFSRVFRDRVGSTPSEFSKAQNQIV